MTTENASVAIAHKDYAVRGGGERLVEELADAFDAPLYIGDNHGGTDIDYDDTRLVAATPRQRWAIRRGGLARAIGYLVAWSNEDRLAEYDVVITSGNEPLWYTPPSGQTLVAYCHSPPRELFDLNHNTGDGTLGTLLRAAKRALFRPNVDTPHLWVANGEEVKQRLVTYWNVDPDAVRVVYPPVDTDAFHPDNAPTGDYYLALGRLAGHKRTEFAADACTALDRRLVVAGRGPQREALERHAGDTVEFAGYVSEERKRELLAGARALLMPAENEDFGMVPVEALVSGTPVIGVSEGMTGDQILDGRNGLNAEASSLGFEDAIRRFEADGVAWDSDEIRAWACERFGRERFREGMRDAVAEAQERARVTGPLRGGEDG